MGDLVENSTKVSKPDGGIASRTRSKSSILGKAPKSSKSLSKSVKLESPIENTLNPLKFPEIWDIILANLGGLEDLKRIRAVSRVWRDNTLNQWRRTAVLILTEEVIQALVEAYLYRKSRNGSDPDSRSGMVVDDHEPNKLFQLFDKPFCNFRYPHDSVGINKMYPLPSLDPENAARILWEQFFPKAKYLDLETCAVKSINNSMSGLKWILKRCPDLIRLDFNPYKWYKCNEDSGTINYTFFGAEDDEVAIASKLESIAIGESLLQPGNEADVYYGPLLNGYGYASAIKINVLLEICPNLKNIWMRKNSREMMVKAMLLNRQFASLGFFDVIEIGRNMNIDVLEEYMKTVRPPLKSLVLKLDRRGNPHRFLLNEDKALLRILNLARKTLTRLELYINCQEEEILEPLDFSDGGRTTFSNLAKLRLHLNYKAHHNHQNTFNLESLRYMKKLKEFWFEMGGKINLDFVTIKLQVEDIQGEAENEGVLPELSLPDLKFFHFHRNFSSGAIRLLGKIAPGLKTLEVVLDKENFTTALETWPKLEQITLLPGSHVPHKLISKQLKIKLRIFNRSQDYIIQGETILVHGVLEREQERMFCKLTKQATFNC